jgi:hypothetical protein
MLDSNTVYAESQGGEAGRIDLRTGLSVSIQPVLTKNENEDKLRWNWNSPIYIGTANPHNLYMGAQYLYKSIDQGRNWSRISPDLTTNDKKKQKQEESGGLSADNTSAENHCTIFTIAESPLDENLIFTGADDGNLQISANGGKTWNNVAAAYHNCGIPAQTWVSSIEPSRFDKNVVYATFDNHNYGDFNTYLAKSSDMGKTWTMLKSDEFSGFAHKIKEDLINKNLLFLGTERGLFCSIDGGATWFRMKNHIPDYCMVRDIKIHPRTNDLILATHGRGIIIVDDITPIREMSQEVAQKGLYFYPMKPIKLCYGKYENGFPEHDGWACDNAPDIPPLQFYSKKRILSSDVSLKIYDMQGNMLRDIPGTKRKGLNKIEWDLRITAPKTAGGGSKPDYGGFIAPMVLPGDYIAKLNVGDSIYSQTIKITPNDNGKMTLEDRQVQYDEAKRCMQMHTDLTALADELNPLISKVEESYIKNKQNKKMKVFLDSLKAFKGTLMATKQTSIFADEERLREKITKVYGAVCYQEARPTNLQLENIDLLKNDLIKAQTKEKVLKEQYDSKWKNQVENGSGYNSNINVPEK